MNTPAHRSRARSAAFLSIVAASLLAGWLIGSLWLRSGWGSYAFGDYYGRGYLTGYQP